MPYSGGVLEVAKFLPRSRPLHPGLRLPAVLAAAHLRLQVALLLLDLCQLHLELLRFRELLPELIAPVNPHKP